MKRGVLGDKQAWAYYVRNLALLALSRMIRRNRGIREDRENTQTVPCVCLVSDPDDSLPHDIDSSWVHGKFHDVNQPYCPIP